MIFQRKILVNKRCEQYKCLLITFLIAKIPYILFPVENENADDEENEATGFNFPFYQPTHRQRWAQMANQNNYKNIIQNNSADFSEFYSSAYWLTFNKRVY